MTPEEKHIMEYIIELVDTRFDEFVVEQIEGKTKEEIIEELKTDFKFVEWFFLDMILYFFSENLLNKLRVPDYFGYDVYYVNGKYIRATFFKEEDKYVFEFVKPKTITVYGYEEI